MAKGFKTMYTDKMGRYMTRSLFCETILAQQKLKGIKPMYTLTGMPGYINVHEMYMDSDDPTGYTFAIAAFQSWKHFQHLIQNCAWFRVYLDEWNEELEVKMRSDAIRSLVKAGKGDRGISAAKYVAERGWESKRGRPSKADIEKHTRQEAMIKTELKADASRLNLV